MNLIDRLRAQRDTIRAQCNEILNRYEQSDEPAEFSAVDEANLTDLTAQATALDARIEQLAQQELAAIAAARVDQQLNAARGTSRGSEPGNGIHQPRSNDTSESLADLPELIAASALADYDGNGDAVMQTTLTVIPSIDVKGNPLAPANRIADAAIPTGSTPILDSIGYEPISTGSATWLEFPIAAPEAADVAEDKPIAEVAYPPVVKSAGLQKFGSNIPLTEEAISDNPRLVAIVQSQLVRGVRKHAEKTAAGVIVTGLADNPYKVAQDTSLINAIRVGIATVQESEFDATRVLLNPYDWAAMDIDLVQKTLRGLMRDTDIWALQVIPSYMVAKGAAYVGDFQIGVKFLDRRDFSVAVSESHGDDFVNDRYRIKARQRGRVVIERPEAIVKCTIGTKQNVYQPDYDDTVKSYQELDD